MRPAGERLVDDDRALPGSTFFLLFLIGGNADAADLLDTFVHGAPTSSIG